MGSITNERPERDVYETEQRNNIEEVHRNAPIYNLNAISRNQVKIMDKLLDIEKMLKELKAK